MRITCTIVDDEPLGRQVIGEFLQAHDDIEVTAEFGDPRTAFEAISASPPDLLFLDIQMPEMNGFELLSLLPQAPVVVFCTAYDQYAIEAFEANAVDYLLKPFDQERLDRALEKARRVLAGTQPAPPLNDLMTYLQARRAQPQTRLAVRKGELLRLIDVSDILWLEALEDYVRVHLANDRYLISQRLGELESRLDESRFIRVHRSSIVNLDHVMELRPGSSGRYKLILTDGNTLETSKSGARRLKELLI